jgi:fructose-specific phosphotransferase system IIC component
MRTIVLSLLIPFSVVQSAFAHGGHMGDLAGHSHWVGWAAAAAAGAVAAWAIKRGTKAKTSGETESDEADADKQPEAAEA